MSIETIIFIVLVVIVAVIIAGGLYFYLRDKSLEEIRGDVYQLFLKAENNPRIMYSGKQKMKWVLQQARGLLPAWAKLLITDALLEKVVQSWFDAIKDLLDDGKLNQSSSNKKE